jgi:hypothetical protein
MVLDEDQEARSDSENYCPRVDKKVLVVDGCCFHDEKSHSCQGCVLDKNFVFTRIVLLLCDMLES